MNEQSIRCPMALRCRCLWIILAVALALGGCVTVPLPRPRVLSLAAATEPVFDGLAPPKGDRGADRVPLPEEFVGMPRKGEKNAYGIVTTAELEVAYDAVLGGDLPQLPGARREALSVAAASGIRARIGNEATEANLRADLGEGAKILHLATHGIFHSDRPLKSAIFLSQGGKSKALTAGEIFEQPLRARLVVLSACETGLGRTVAGDDMLGLVRSFYLGGTRSVVSSLWPVEDRGTQRFMEIFHRRAASGDYGRAWMTARNHLKKKGFPPAVYGAFILGGDMAAP